MFCAICGDDKRTDCLPKHCKGAHNVEEQALEPNMAPTQPKYENWQEYIAGYPHVTGKQVLDYKDYEAGKNDEAAKRDIS